MNRLKKWKMLLIGIVASIGVILSTSQASAAPPNEDANFQAVTVSDGAGGTENVDAGGQASEARNGTNMVRVWGGRTNFNMYISINNGPPRQIAGQTYAPPQVISWGSTGFMLAHTGENGNIYYLPLLDENQLTLMNWETALWQQVGGNNFTSIFQPVSLTQAGPGSRNVMMAYRGAGQDTRLFALWYDSTGAGWVSGPVQVVAGATSQVAPNVVFNPNQNAFFLTYAGTNNVLYFTFQTYGSSPWSASQAMTGDRGWGDGDFFVTSPPSAAVLSDGTMQFAVLDTARHVRYAQLYPTQGVSTWTTERSGRLVDYPPTLSTQWGNPVIWTVVTAAATHLLWWKASYRK
jgi:hypothetical protein